MKVRYDEFDGFWEVVDDDGETPIAGPFDDEQEAADWIEFNEQ